ncbi:MAG TPA: hypothetical protein PLA12_14215 [Candidatus Hydrogenedens sp.]|nr:hypothetical protein [Candidatus Hydrogenedens sp.]
MTATLRTLVGVQLGTGASVVNIPVQVVNLAQNPEWLKLKATSSVNNDLTALTKLMPELELETHDIKGLLSFFNNQIYKVDTCKFYMGTFASTPTDNLFYSKTGVLVAIINEAVIYLDKISGDIGEPLTATFKVRGSAIEVDTQDITSFAVTHSAVSTISTVTFGANVVGIRNLDFSTNIEFYDHYDENIDPSVSAITNVDIQVKLRLLVDDFLATQALETATDFTLNLKKYQSFGAPTTGGTITLGQCAVNADTLTTQIGEVATAEVTLLPKTIAFALA